MLALVVFHNSLTSSRAPAPGRRSQVVDTPNSVGSLPFALKLMKGTLCVGRPVKSYGGPEWDWGTWRGKDSALAAESQLARAKAGTDQGSLVVTCGQRWTGRGSWPRLSPGDSPVGLTVCCRCLEQTASLRSQQHHRGRSR